MNIVQKPIGDIRPYKNNPRKNTKAVDAVAESITRYGFLVPIALSADGEIVAGETRYKAAKKLKLKTVPCVVADELNEEQIKAFRLVDNKVGEIAEWDMDLLNAELYALSEDLSIFAFDLPVDGGGDGGSGEKGGGSGSGSGFNYQEQYGVIVMCEDEAHQQEVYETLSGMGYECKVVAT